MTLLYDYTLLFRIFQDIFLRVLGTLYDRAENNAYCKRITAGKVKNIHRKVTVRSIRVILWIRR